MITDIQKIILSRDNRFKERLKKNLYNKLGRKLTYLNMVIAKPDKL